MDSKEVKRVGTLVGAVEGREAKADLGNGAGGEGEPGAVRPDGTVGEAHEGGDRGGEAGDQRAVGDGRNHPAGKHPGGGHGRGFAG